MPWNEPGSHKNSDPWGNKNGQQPPNLDKIISDFVKKIRQVFHLAPPTKKPPQTFKNHHYGFWSAVAIVFFLWFLSGFFIVNPAEEAVVLRFGKYSDNLKPGLHWIARFIETKYLVDVQKVYSFSVQGDFLTKSSEQNDSLNALIKSDQSKNLVNVELSVQYRISNPKAFLFSLINPDETIQQVTMGALSDVIGKMKLDDVLTTGHEFVSSGVLERIRELLNNYQSGLEVVAVTLRKVQAPDQVRVAFNDVNRADQDKATTIQQAQAYASKVVPLAQGMAARILANANAYQQQIVLTAQANVARYQALLKVYQSSPQVTQERMYIDTMQNILQRCNKILVDANVGNNLIYLPIDKIFRQQEQLANEEQK